MTTPLTENYRSSLKAVKKLTRCEPGNEVVISGISGVFPDSDDVEHFRQNLFSKKVLASNDDRRWKLENPEIPQRIGKLNVLNKFDAAFFGINRKQVNSMDPMSRIFLEKVYEAIVDAGYNPRQLQGSKTGVFVGVCFSETERAMFDHEADVNGFGITGCSRAMIANRVSYWLNINGPSYAIDSACSSSLYAIDQAYKAIRNGSCDAAIVGGCNLCLHPNMSWQFARLGVLSMDGLCKSFDDSADGYSRSEAVVAVFLQKARDARRIYAEVVHSQINCDGYKEQGITYPSNFMQKRLFEEFYDECEIEPSTLNYIEAHGTGTKVGDVEELNAISAMFCRNRKTPLKIGSVKSNMGHSEAASGLCSLVKVVLAYEHGVIPPNINFETPRSEIEAFREGKITVVTEPTPWQGGLAGINNFGFGGANCHVLLNSNRKTKVDNLTPLDNLPRMVCVSGRTEEAVDVLLTDLESRPLDLEFIGLLHEVHCEDIPGHIYRGYTLLRNDTADEITRHIEYFSGEKRPVWFVFAGMGSQWPTMGKDMMKIPAFSNSICESHRVLKAHNVNLIEIITSNDPKIFDNILHCFVGIAAVQIALVDLLSTIGLKPSGIIGHSVGELGCAYADGCFSAEQTILAAYYRGLVSLESNFIPGSMAAIGLEYDAVNPSLPSDIDIACHNSANNCTISGPSDSVKNFISSLQEVDVFAREVNSCGIAYHSRYIGDAAPKLLAYLKQVIPEPKLRSERWISSSWLKGDWDDEKTKYSSAEYHTNNLLGCVYFEEASREIPANAIVIEIAPRGLLQAILKRSLSSDTVNIPLMSRDQPDSCVKFFHTALGRIYEAGSNFRIQNLYPPVEFPVSRGTPMIAPLVKWDHSEDWYVIYHRNMDERMSGERTVRVTLKKKDLEYLSGHIIDGRNLYPATAYLLLAWETLALMKGKAFSDVSVIFENVRFHRATTIPREGNIELTVLVQKSSGNFEVVEGDASVVTGRVYTSHNIDAESLNLPPPQTSHKDEDTNLSLNAKDVYTELKLRGYEYKGLFKGITYSNSDGNIGRIAWKNNFVAFMDNMLQMRILQEDTRGLFVPTAIQKMIINCKKHFGILHTLDKVNPEFDVYVHKEMNSISCGGIEIRNLKADSISKRKMPIKPVLEKYQFVPHMSIQRNVTCWNFRNTIAIGCHLILENLPPSSTKLKIAELIDDCTKPEELVFPILLGIFENIPSIQADVTLLTSSQHPLITTEDLIGITIDDSGLPENRSYSIIIASHILHKEDILQKALCSLKRGGFIMTRETSQHELPPDSSNLDICFDHTIEDERILLIREPENMDTNPVVIRINGETYSWIPEVQKALNSLNSETNQKLVLYAEAERYTGILGFFNCLQRELRGKDVKCFYIADDDAPAFSLQHEIYKTQFAKNLAVNVYKNGTWGSYRHLLLENVDDIGVPHAYVSALVRGDLSSLKWIEGPLNPLKYKSDRDSMLVHVYFASLNFRDVMIATGKLASEVVCKNRFDQECVLGLEYAGKTEDGQRYMGIASSKAMASLVESEANLQWKVPDDWSLEEAATVPVAYATVLYAFQMCGRLKKNDRVLIHAGSGGVGQAAINLCLFYECEIFTTVGSADKRKFIRETFPRIPDTHIGNSRDNSFEKMVMKETSGKGVDLVLNSLAEEKLLASVRCLGEGGRFLEIGKYDLVNNNPLGMEHFLKGISFHGVMLDRLILVDKKQMSMLRSAMQKCIEDGAVKPLVRSVFAAHEVEAAFRYMAAGKHIGKVLLKIRDEESTIDAKPETLLFKAARRYLCSNEKSFIICGGLGGFGLELADWLVTRGARKLILTSRTGITKGYQSRRVKIWRSYGVNVVISTEDITKENGVRKLLNVANTLGPVSAIFNLAAVLRDAMFNNQTEESFEFAAAPKTLVTYYLDQLSRTMCPTLEQFVVFSSQSCGRGNIGQTNYGMANSSMERICEARKAENLPALAIQWGAIGDVGLVADMTEDNPEVVIGGLLQQRIASCLEVLDYFMNQRNPIVASMVVPEKISTESGSGKTLVDTMANILGLRNLKTFSLHLSFAELGMDSMMAVEVKQTLEREFQVFLTSQEIRDLTFDKLHKMKTANEYDDRKEETDTNKEEKKMVVPDQINLDYLLRLFGNEKQLVEPIVRLPSFADEGSPTGNCSTVFIFPGIEGVASAMEPLGVHFDLHVLCLQYDYKNPSETIEGLAKSLLEPITSRLAGNQEFYVIGYSFGGVVAMAVMKLLEENGKTGRLWLIDSSPEYLRTLGELMFTSGKEVDRENDVQLKVILKFLDTLSFKTSPEIFDQLQKLSSWNLRLEFVTSLPLLEIQSNKDCLRSAMNAMYCRIKAQLDYRGFCGRTLKAPTTLIRPTERLILLEDDYGLAKFCSSPVEVHFVEGNHVTILENKKTADIIAKGIACSF